MPLIIRILFALLIFSSVSLPLSAAHKVIMQGNGKLAIVDQSGEVEWEMPWKDIHDLHLLENGNILTVRGFREVVEIDHKTKEVVWSYDCAEQNGNSGKKIEIHAIQPLEEGQVMIAESGVGRIIEIDRSGKLLKTVPLKIDHPHPHRDTRLARKISNGNYLVCHEGDGVVREYDGKSGKVIWEYEIPLFGKEPQPGHGLDAFGNSVYAALRLENGNTLIATGNGHSVIEVTPGKEIVWALHQDDLAGIRFAWVTILEVLPNGNYIIGNCHAGPENPLLVEIAPKSKEVVWTFDQYNRFGNSAPTSQIMDVSGKVNR
ncbi:MAG: PQQ-binding-like beta-propeller repeat protein [Planctomycetaceae bacterium]